MRKLTWAGLTDVGRKRSENEDAYIVDPQLGVYIVCDGMGGHASGEVASAMTIDEMHKFFVDRANGANDLPYEGEPDASEGELALSNAVQYANDKVYVQAMLDPKLEGMGTTVVSLLEYEDHFVLAHVGDSRIYRLRDNHLEQVTRDHSLLNHKIDLGELTTPEQIAGFKHGNVIVRAIGLKDYVRPETSTQDRVPGDVYLLCSDGLSDLVDDWTLEGVLQAYQHDLDEAARILIRMANDRGGKDNITTVLVRVDDDPEDYYAGYEPYEDDYDYEPHPPSLREESTRPTMKAFEDEHTLEHQAVPANNARFKSYGEPVGNDELTAPHFKAFNEVGDDEERTAPHSPIFAWDDEDDDDLPIMRTGATGRPQPPARPGMETRRRIQPNEELPAVIVDDEPEKPRFRKR